MRALVIAPSGRDAEVIMSALSSAGIKPVAGDLSDLIAAISTERYGMTIILDDALGALDLVEVDRALAAQPPWADYPFIILTKGGAAADAASSAADRLGNATLIEWPFDPATLTAAAGAALRARGRQRQTRLYLAERSAAEERLLARIATLESRVLERTAELNRASTEREAALDHMKESEELYRFAVELNALIPWTADSAGELQTIGTGWIATTGLAIEEARGDGWTKALHPDDQQAILSHWRSSARSGLEFDVDYRLRRKDGTYIWCRARAAPRFNSDGTVLRYYGTVTDVDERRRATERLQQVQSELIHVSRLSAMDAMASTLAHELNQPLTAIANYLRGCVRLIADVRGDSVPMIIEALTEADNSAVRAGKIMRSLREMVTQGNLVRTREDLRQLISQACRVALVDAGTLGIRFRLDLAPEVPTVTVDRVQIQQVLINLVRNSVEALRNMPDREILVATYPLSDSFCEVMVRDNGPGLAPEAKRRLFSAFNSTKANGMGIGLSISRTIIELHGGDIWADSHLEGGASFHFTLPSSPE